MSLQTFIFDFDSTIFPGESLDEIIQLSLEGAENAVEKKAQITTICNQGMSGEISMKESLKKRLEIAAPSKEIIARYVLENMERINDSIKQLLAQLQEHSHQVFVVSGGFEEWIKPLLNGIIPSDNIYANQIIDKERPMLFENINRRDKEQLIRENLQEVAQQTYIIGDGATDFSVYENGLAQHFLGTFFYSGTAAREKVLKKASAAQQEVFKDLNAFILYFKKYIKR